MSGKIYRVVFITAPNPKTAKELATLLVESKLAACCNLIKGITSVYRWRGKINSDPEVLIVVKTEKSLVKKIVKLVVQNHPYDVAEVISLPIDDGSPLYLNWLSESLATGRKAIRAGKRRN